MFIFLIKSIFVIKSGAKQGGALGFAKGVGRGLVGVVVKPVVGVVDAASDLGRF